MAKRLTYYILAGLVLGIIVGWIVNATIGDATPAQHATLERVAGYFSIITTIFLRLIKMIIAPLVFSTLVAAIVHMGDTAALGRVALAAQRLLRGKGFVKFVAKFLLRGERLLQFLVQCVEVGVVCVRGGWRGAVASGNLADEFAQWLEVFEH